MIEERDLAEAFQQMHEALLRINEILRANPGLAENVPIKLPLTLDPDEMAAECHLLAEYYAKRAMTVSAHS
jgi:hypothetical protein